MASKLTKKPENKRNGTDITGAKNTPFCTFIAAPTTRPTDCATNEINKHALRNILNRMPSVGWLVRKYTIVTYIMQNIAWNGMSDKVIAR